MCRAPWSSILFVVNYCCTCVLMYAKMLKETENEETRLFWQIFVIGGILIKGARVPSATPWLRQWFWDKIAPLISSFIKKTSKSKLKELFFQNVEDSSQVTWQFFETSTNCMTLLWRGHVVLIISAYFCTINPKLKKLQFRTGTTYWPCSLYIYHW